MRVGSVVYATDQGLGILAKSFFDNGVVTDVAVIRHGRHPEHENWYPGAPRVGDLRKPQALYELCDRVDVMFFFETPFHWPLIDHCRKKGVKTALMPMFECEHSRLPATPDLFINPSHLDQQYYPQGVHIPVPVEYPWKQRTRAEVFVHNSGHGGLKGRNGTAEFVEAARLVKSPAKLILRAQESSRQYWAAERLRQANELPGGLPGNVEVICRTVPYEELFATGDVFVFPEKFNGLSLPLQEARAAGMLVMCGDRFPMNQWLPREPLIPVSGYRKNRIGPPYNEFDEAIIEPAAIAAKVDEWYGRDLTEYSLAGRAWAESMSWAALKPKYTATLEALAA
jgi:glycosyltransferase involved in cell wall biosynthesis